jgi:hypothetical protein
MGTSVAVPAAKTNASAALKFAGQGRAGEPFESGDYPFQRLGGRGIFAQRADYSGHCYELSRNELRGLKAFLTVEESASPLYCARKSAERTFIKQKRSLSAPPCPAAHPAATAQTSLSVMAPAPLLSRPLWLYSRAMQTEVLADASL